MKCLKCQNELSFPVKKIIKHGEQNYEAHLCPQCDHILSERKVRLGQVSRMIILLTVFPFLYIIFLLFSFSVRQYLEMGYYEVLILTIVSVLILVLVAEVRKKLSK